MTKPATRAILVLSALSLGACTEAHPLLTADFGQAVREDAVAQIADPEAHYLGRPAPGSDGARVALAQDRYRKGKVIPPTPATGFTVGALMAPPNEGP